MHQTKTAAPVRQHRNCRKEKSNSLILHQIPRLVQRLIIGAGSGGLGLAVGTALPPLLGLTAWRWDLTLAGLARCPDSLAVHIVTSSAPGTHCGWSSIAQASTPYHLCLGTAASWVGCGGPKLQLRQDAAVLLLSHCLH